jgi:hypothetical protein
MRWSLLTSESILSTARMIGVWKVCRVDGFHSSAVAFCSALADLFLRTCPSLSCVSRYGSSAPTVTWADGPQGTVFDPCWRPSCL